MPSNLFASRRECSPRVSHCWGVAVTLALLASPAAAERQAACTWQPQLFTLPAGADPAQSIEVAGFADNGEIIARKITGFRPRESDATYVSRRGQLIDLQALMPPEYQRSEPYYISPSGNAVVGAAYLKAPRQNREPHHFWVYRNGKLKFLYLGDSLKRADAHPVGVGFAGVTDSGVVYGTVHYSAPGNRAFGSTGNLLNALGDEPDNVSTSLLGNRVGTVLVTRLISKKNSIVDQQLVMWQGSAKGQWAPIAADIPIDLDYRISALSDAGTLLEHRWTIGQGDRPTAAQVLDPLNQTQAFLVGLSRGGGYFNHIAPSGAYVAAEVVTAENNKAALYTRDASNVWSSRGFEVEGAIDTWVSGVNSRGEVVGTYSFDATQIPIAQSHFLYKDGVTTSIRTISPTLIADGYHKVYLNERGQVALTATDTQTGQLVPVVMNCRGAP